MIGLLKLRIGWVFEMDTEIEIFEGIAEFLEDMADRFEKYGIVPMVEKANSLREDVENIVEEMKAKENPNAGLEMPQEQIDAQIEDNRLEKAQDAEEEARAEDLVVDAEMERKKEEKDETNKI